MPPTRLASLLTRWVPTSASMLIMAIASAVLAYWLLFASGLLAAHEALLGLRANTAIAFLLSALSLRLLASMQESGTRKAVGRAAATLVALIGLLTLLEYVFSLNLAIDDWLPQMPSGPAATDQVARMPPNSALCALLAGLALLVLDSDGRKSHPSQAMALAIAVIAFLSLTGYAYSAPGLYRIGQYAYMAPLSALCWLALAAGILSARPDRGFMIIVTDSGPGGITVRRMLPALCVLSLLVGWLRLAGERAGLYAPSLGVALMVATMIACFGWLTISVARSLNRADAEERQLAEERTRHLLAAQSARLNEAILDALAEGLLLVDDDDLVVKVNPSAERLLGKSAAALIGAAIPDALDSGSSQTVKDKLVTVQQPHGAKRLLRLNRLPVDHNGHVLTFRDVTHEEAVSRLKSEFISLASHELRTPMTILKGYVEILLREDQLQLTGERQNAILERLLTQTNRLAKIVNDLLNVSRIEQGTIACQTRPMAIEPVLQDVLEDVTPFAARKGIHLHLSLPADPLPQVQADAGQVRQIVHNLLDNAIKYSESDRTIEMVAAPAGRYLRVSVRDQGIGIATPDLPLLFERFHRIQSPQTLQERGTGLGLYISRTLAEQQGGILVACSQAGEGSTFTLTLPLSGLQAA